MNYTEIRSCLSSLHDLAKSWRAFVNGTEAAKHICPPAVGVDQLLTERQAAVALLISVKTLQAWRVEGRNVPFVRIGRRIAYRVRDINDFIERNRFASTSEADVARAKCHTTPEHHQAGTMLEDPKRNIADFPAEFRRSK